MPLAWRASDGHSFPFIAEEHPLGSICHLLFILGSAAGHLGYFWFGAMVNVTAVKITYILGVGICFISLGCILRDGIALTSL